MTSKLIAYVISASITGWLFGRHVYKEPINSNFPERGGDLQKAIMLGILGGLFWQITWLWAILKALTGEKT